MCAKPDLAAVAQAALTLRNRTANLPEHPAPKLKVGKLRCRHCRGRKRKLKARRLCVACYYDLAIRKKYAPTTTTGRRGVALGEVAGRLPAVPTDALPGSPEKIAVLADRAARGEALFHPRDARLVPVFVDLG